MWRRRADPKRYHRRVDAHEFLQNLATVLGVAALTTVIFQRLRLPVVLGYLIAGLIIGPHVPIALVADAQLVQVLSELGVILLMFSLGLELSVRSLARVGISTVFIAVIECSLMLWLGFVVGRAFGWTTTESVFAGAMVAISSTTIIARTFDEQRTGGKLRELVFGVLVVEDLVAILLLTALTAIGSGQGTSAGALAETAGRLAGFLALLLAGGLLIVPPLMRLVVRLERAETTLVASIGLCFATALLASEMGYSVALGAFIAGSLVAESGEAETVERLVHPVRDMFAAIFFVSVGMQIDPALLAEHWFPVVALCALVMIGKLLNVSLATFLAGHGVRNAVQTGMSMAQIGEFSFIIAALGISLGAVGDFLYPVAVAVSAVTALTTPALVRGSAAAAGWVDRRLPRPIQTFAALYGAWIDGLRSAPRDTAGARLRRTARWLAVDAMLVCAVVIGASLSQGAIAAWLAATTRIELDLARALVIAGAVVATLPFLWGMIGLARRLGLRLAEVALPAASGAAGGGLDLTATPRRALVVGLQLGCLLIVAAPVIALTQPFLPPLSAVVLVVVVLVLGFAFWRSAADLEGHVRAGAEMIVEALSSRAGPPPAGPVDHGGAAPIHDALRGLGAPEVILVAEGSAVAGKSLATLNLRGATGATVLAIRRGTTNVVVPSGDVVLETGDALALAGSLEAIAAARTMLGASAGAGDVAGGRGRPP